MDYFKLNVDTIEVRAEILAVTGLGELDVEASSKQWLAEQNIEFVVAKYWGAADVAKLTKLQPILSKIGPVSHGQLFVCKPNHLGIWHLDGNIRNAAINVPLYNCASGIVEWTNDEVDGVLEVTPYTKTWCSKTENLTRSDSIQLTEAIALRTSKWHRLDNRACSNYRWVFSIRFSNNPTLDDMYRSLHT